MPDFRYNEYMKYSTVEILPYIGNKWLVNHSEMSGDRQAEKLNPSPMGFFHYPRRMGKKKAFEQLKALLIEKHEEEIKRLNKSLAALKKVEL